MLEEKDKIRFIWARRGNMTARKGGGKKRDERIIWRNSKLEETSE